MSQWVGVFIHLSLHRPEDRPTFAELVIGIKEVFAVLSQETVPVRPPRPTPVPRSAQIPFRN